MGCGIVGDQGSFMVLVQVSMVSFVWGGYVDVLSYLCLVGKQF